MYLSESFYIFEENCRFHLQGNGALRFSFSVSPLFTYSLHFLPFYIFFLLFPLLWAR